MLFTLLSWIYKQVTHLRNEAYETGFWRTYNAGVYTISVGNLSMGGTGKTPVAAHLIEKAILEGKRVAYLSRGYGRKTKGYLRVNPQTATATEVGDEALQIAMMFPSIVVAVCENRVEGAEYLQKDTPIDILILDDAFQHRRIYRDKDIVVIDARQLPTNDAVFPKGRLRESIEGLYRADEIVVNHCYDKQQISEITSCLMPYISKQCVLKFRYPELGKAKAFFSEKSMELAQQKGVAFCGIGNAEGFYNSLTQKDVTITQKFTYKDHHFYTEKEIEAIIASSHNQPIFTTYKDYARLKNASFQKLLASAPFYYVEMKLKEHL